MQYTIKEFSELINKSPSTLRNWDKTGFLKPAYIGKNGYRYYDENQIMQFKQSKNDIQLGLILKGDNKELIERYLVNTGYPYKLVEATNNCYNLIGLIIKELRLNNINKIIIYSNEKFKNDIEFELIEDFEKLLKIVAISFKSVVEYIKEV